MIKLGEMEKLFRELPLNFKLSFGIGDPDSWRGSYDEVAFKIHKNITVEQCLEAINEAKNGPYYGWKGGEFSFDDDTPVNFENGPGEYSGGEYTWACINHICESMNYDIHSNIFPMDSETLVKILLMEYQLNKE